MDEILREGRPQRHRLVLGGMHELELVGVEGLTIVPKPLQELVGHAGLDVVEKRLRALGPVELVANDREADRAQVHA